MFLEYITLLDYASLAIMILLLASIYIKKLYTLKSSKMFISLIIISIITCIFDILSVNFFNEPYELLDVYKELGFIFNSIYYILRTSTVIFYTLYVLQLTDSLKKILKSPLRLILFSLPVLICYVFEIMNLFNHMVFNVGIENNRFYFETGTVFAILLYVLPSLYFIFSFMIIIKYKYYFTRSQLISIISIMPLSILSFVFQFISKTTNFTKDVILVELFASTLGMVLIVSTIESASELIDTKTGLISFNSFNKVISRMYTNKSKLSLIIIEISNYYKLQNKFNYESINSYIRDVSYNLIKLSKQYNAISYSIDDGIYALKFETSNILYERASGIMEYLNNTYKKEFKPEFKMCIIDLPNDFSNRDSLIKFIRNFHNNYYLSSKISVYNELKNDRGFIIKNNLDSILENAFIKNEYEVYYQPIFDIKNNKFSSAEALVRLNSSEYGFIEPSYFIEYAEITGKIGEIDLFVIEECIKFIASDEFYESGLEVININLSVIDCLDLVLFNKVVDLINLYKIDARCLHFELIEGNELIDRKIVYDTINQFIKIGITFSLDNYGTGYSNFRNFTKAPIDTIKLDRSLVKNSKSKDMDYLLSNTINLIKDLGKNIVIEGVETKEKLNEFLKYECDYIQGYYYSKPVKKDELLDFIKNYKGVE